MEEEKKEKPKCFQDCKCGDLSVEHCANRDYPPMLKCLRCDYWYTNLEKKGY